MNIGDVVHGCLKCLVISFIFLDTIMALIDNWTLGKVFAVTNPRFTKQMVMKVFEMNLAIGVMNSNISLNNNNYLEKEWNIGNELGRSQFLIEVVEYFIENDNAVLIIDYYSNDLQNVINTVKEHNIRISQQV
jgi:hypothetical protein